MSLKEILQEQAEEARSHLADAGKEGNNTRACGVEVVHQNPVNDQECRGLIVLNFVSWNKAVKSPPMEGFGYVCGICEICGFKGYLDKEKSWVE